MQPHHNSTMATQTSLVLVVLVGFDQKGRFFSLHFFLRALTKSHPTIMSVGWRDRSLGLDCVKEFMSNAVLQDVQQM